MSTGNLGLIFPNAGFAMNGIQAVKDLTDFFVGFESPYQGVAVDAKAVLRYLVESKVLGDDDLYLTRLY